jgi:hypothetical protein
MKIRNATHFRSLSHWPAVGSPANPQEEMKIPLAPARNSCVFCECLDANLKITNCHEFTILLSEAEEWACGIAGLALAASVKSVDVGW